QGVRASVREGACLLVAARAVLSPIAGEPDVVEEAPPQLDFRIVHGVVGRDARRGEARRQSPGPSRGREDQGRKEDGLTSGGRGATSRRTSAKRAASCPTPTSRTLPPWRDRRFPGSSGSSRATCRWPPRA